MKFLISFILATLLTLIALKYLPFPYLWISLCWFSCFVFFTLMTKKSSHKPIWFNFAFLFIVFGFIEAFSWVSLTNSVKSIRQEEGYFSSDEILGYAPTKGKIVHSIAYKGKEILYNVTYTIGDNGLRISPPPELANNNQCIVFFGDSHTFGEGVEDYEAMPYLVGELSKSKVYNFGFHGYGPHQMLSALEHGIVERVVDCKPSVAVYQAIMDHAARSAGSSPWDTHGPKYILLSDGTLKYDGHFDDRSIVLWGVDISIILSRVGKQIEKSFIYKRYFYNRRRDINDRDVKLFLEIVDASRKNFTGLYPGSAFHVILWNENPEDKYYNMVQEGLRKKGINLHLISNILPNFSDRRSTYEISPYERHPNTLAHMYIAQYVIGTILGR
jgi:hypothetical protein